MKRGLNVTSAISSSASWGWRGKARGWDLQALRAHVKKFSVRSFIFCEGSCRACVMRIRNEVGVSVCLDWRGKICGGRLLEGADRSA